MAERSTSHSARRASTREASRVPSRLKPASRQSRVAVVRLSDFFATERIPHRTIPSLCLSPSSCRRDSTPRSHPSPAGWSSVRAACRLSDLITAHSDPRLLSERPLSVVRHTLDLVCVARPGSLANHSSVAASALPSPSVSASLTSHRPSPSVSTYATSPDSARSASPLPSVSINRSSACPSPSTIDQRSAGVLHPVQAEPPQLPRPVDAHRPGARAVVGEEASGGRRRRDRSTAWSASPSPSRSAIASSSRPSPSKSRPTASSAPSPSTSVSGSAVHMVAEPSAVAKAVLHGSIRRRGRLPGVPPLRQLVDGLVVAQRPAVQPELLEVPPRLAHLGPAGMPRICMISLPSRSGRTRARSSLAASSAMRRSRSS